ncbi:MAG: isoprenylcysteine carboxylmethyltransferase family protein [Thermoanaerobaculia bacterium]
MSHELSLSLSERRAIRIVAAYSCLQGLAIVAWWGLLATRPEWVAPFLADGTPVGDLLAFRLPDLAFLALGSLVGGLLVFLHSRWAAFALALVAGGLAYATLYCISLALASDSAWASVALMAPAAAATLLGAGVIALANGVIEIRVTRSEGVPRQVAKSALQIVILWGLALAFVPLAIVFFERRLGLPGFEFSGQRPVGILLFACASAFGLWGTSHMNRYGRGTPLPFDTAPYLVLSGPYARIRNPMALGGWLQASAVAFYLGSWVVLAYAAFGALAWNYLARPFEESDLAHRFGADYERYRDAVPCWRLRRKPYSR